MNSRWLHNTGTARIAFSVAGVLVVLAAAVIALRWRPTPSAAVNAAALGDRTGTGAHVEPRARTAGPLEEESTPREPVDASEPELEPARALGSDEVLLRVSSEKSGDDELSPRIVHIPVEGPGLHRDQPVHPGRRWTDHVWSTAPRSPLRFRLGPGPSQIYWVGAPGHQWHRLNLANAAGTERTIELAEAGDLTVRVWGVTPGHLAYVRILDPLNPSPLVQEFAVQQDTEIVLEGWPSGEYLCQLEVGSGAESEVLAGEAVRTVSGTAPSIDLVCPSILTEGLEGRVEGTLELPDGAMEIEGLRASLRIELLPREKTVSYLARSRHEFVREFADMKPEVADGLLLGWSFERIPPGEYALIVRPLGMSEPLDVRPLETRRARIRVPDLATCRVRFVRGPDATAFDPAQVSAILASQMEQELASEVLELHAFHLERGSYLFTGVPGRLRIAAMDARMVMQERTFEATAGESAFDFVFAENPRVVLRLLHDGRSVEVPLEWWFRIEVIPLDPSNRQESRLVRGDGSATPGATDRAFFDCSAAGSYRFVFPELAGYKTLPARVFYVTDDQAQVFLLDLLE